MLSCASVDRACIRARHKRLGRIPRSRSDHLRHRRIQKGSFNFPTPNHTHLEHDLSPCPPRQSQPKIHVVRQKQPHARWNGNSCFVHYHDTEQCYLPWHDFRALDSGPTSMHDRWAAANNLPFHRLETIDECGSWECQHLLELDNPLGWR